MTKESATEERIAKILSLIMSKPDLMNSFEADIIKKARLFFNSNFSEDFSYKIAKDGSLLFQEAALSELKFIYDKKTIPYKWDLQFEEYLIKARKANPQIYSGNDFSRFMQKFQFGPENLDLATYYLKKTDAKILNESKKNNDPCEVSYKNL